MEKPSNKTTSSQPLSPIAHLVMVGVGLGLSYAAFSVAVDKGSIVLYLTAVALFALAARHLVQAFEKKKRGTTHERSGK
jgi:hypothetical protein